MQASPSFLTSEVETMETLFDRSFGSVFARRRGLGILSLARLARSQDEYWPRCLILFVTL